MSRSSCASLSCGVAAQKIARQFIVALQSLLGTIARSLTDLIGRRSGDDIVQFCLGADRPEKWVFSRITARSFLWQAFVLEDDGLTWRADTEFQLHRID